MSYNSLINIVAIIVFKIITYLERNHPRQNERSVDEVLSVSELSESIEEEDMEMLYEPADEVSGLNNLANQQGKIYVKIFQIIIFILNYLTC